MSRVQIKFYCTGAERDALRSLASAAGYRSVGAFIRSLLRDEATERGREWPAPLPTWGTRPDARTGKEKENAV
jgi:hypothetical protein